MISIESTIITLAFVAVVFFILKIYAKYKLNYWKRRGVESLPSDLIFGNFKEAVLFRSAPGWHLGQLYKKAPQDAPYIGFYIFHKPCLLLRDPEIIKQFLIRDFENFSDRHFAGSNQKDSIGMKNLFGLKNPAWKYLRSKITPTLTRGKLKQMFPLMMEIGGPMMDHLRKQSTINKNNVKIVDAQELSYTYTTDLIASVALGTKMDSFNYPNNEFSAAVSEFFHGFKRMVALVTVFFMPELVEIIGANILFNSKFVRKVFWSAMENREKTGEKRGDFIDSLLQLKNGEQNPKYKFEGENLLYQSGTFFSGFESSSTCMSFTLMELANNMKCQERAREDINKAIDKYGWTYEAFNKMKYLDQAIAEGLRLHPPVSTIDRYTRENYQIPGTDIIIEKGIPIYISLYGLQEDPKYFDEPEVYNPDRFAEGTYVPDAYIPFGIGPRMCVGMKVGQLHAKVVLALLLREYEIWQEEKDKSVLDPRSTFTAAANGIQLHFKKRFDSFINGLLFIFIPAIVFYFWMKHKLSYWKRRGVPSLPISLLLRQLKDVILVRKSGSIALGDLYKEANEKDKFFGIYILHKPFLLIKDNELIKSILIKDFDVFCDRYFSVKSANDMATFNLFSADNPEWKHLRVKMSPVFTSGKIKKLFYLMHETSEAMQDFLQEKFRKNSNMTIDAKDVFMKYTTDVISTVAFGVRTNSFKEETSEFYQKSLIPFTTNLRRYLSIYKSFFFPELNKKIEVKMMGEAREYFSQLFWDTFNEREKSGTKRRDLIDYLIELKHEEQNDDFKFEGDILLGQSLIFFIAGRESTATTICYALAELARESKLQDRLRTEIRETLKSDGFTYETVQKMKYLHQVISETLRLHPPAPIIDRVATKDYVIPGTNVLIEKGTPVYAVLTGIHVDPKYFPDPLRFDPDRFSDERKADILPYTYMPFGDGPRVCIAQRVGMLQTAVGIIRVINNYEVLLNLNGDYKHDPANMFLKPGKNFILDLKKITVEN
ncbi:cytochrome P450 6k1-like [Polistes fuscatus]|uniref:cytochrome P450 6k1-like n=1 Tax=Polistes fuscatus TaxID=30207 RepID=UPI001CA89FC4|nr:cytochrome P450 6k1-like [Polistes fuscatus]